VSRNDAPPIPDELAKICTRMRLPYLRKAGFRHPGYRSCATLGSSSS
jgi:hypothetical protein